MRCPRCGKELETEAKLCPNCKSIRFTPDDSPYATVLKPHSTIDVKGIGSKMVGSSYVKATRHKIAALDRSDSSQKIRCTNCGTVNDKSDQFCRNCGTRITS